MADRIYTEEYVFDTALRFGEQVRRNFGWLWSPDKCREVERELTAVLMKHRAEVGPMSGDSPPSGPQENGGTDAETR